jgi:hypothetical protein
MSKNKDIKEAFDATPAEIPSIAHAVLSAGLVPYIMGPPGLGKSTMLAALSTVHGRKFHDLRLAYYSPTDVAGMPYLGEEQGDAVMKFAQMGLMPRDPGGFLFLDEFPLAPRATQNSALQLVLDGRVGSYTLPPDTWVAMAGNRSEDRCFGERMSAAMVNRIVAIRLKPSLDDWTEWAYQRGIDLRIVAYVRFNPASLMDFNPTEWDGEGNFASPRSWEALNKLMSNPAWAQLSRPVQRKLMVGAIGHAVGNEFAGYIEVYDELPSIESVLLDPEVALVPTEASARIAAAAMVANHATRQTLPRLMVYASRFEKPFEMFAVKAIIGRDRSLLTSPDIVRWVSANRDAFQD